MKKVLVCLMSVVLLIMAGCRKPSAGDYPIKPVPFTQVQVTDSFWLPKIETNRTVTIPFAFRKSEETGRIANFAVAGKVIPGKFCSKYGYDDSDVYKIIEGASYSLATHPDPKLETYLDSLANLIAKAQEPDGYLYTMRTINPDSSWAKNRWERDPLGSHELYNVGHFYEAAVAHYQATGKRTLLDVAIKNADLLVNTFGPDKLHITPGHPETEIGLVKLYRATGNKKYLELARFFVDQRGKRDPDANPKYYREYILTHKPLLEQNEAVGHAVRALYLYAGATDIAALMNDKAYLKHMDKLWEDVVYRKIYITGGVGAWPAWEAFGPAYALPNDTAYAETCAAIANVLWNQRMFLLHGDSKYIDVLERSLYNGVISGYSLDGTRFFYPNPLESDGKTPFNMGSCTRQEWFDCSCCPSNLARFIPSVPGYIYAFRRDTVYVNLFISSRATIVIGNNALVLEQETRYPWDGKVKLTLHPAPGMKTILAVRLPGWVQGKPLPGDLYSYLNSFDATPQVVVNGQPVSANFSNGYLLLNYPWKDGDIAELEFPMAVRKVIANPLVKDDEGKMAVERGPVVYCAEGADNPFNLENISVPEDAEFEPIWKPELLKGVIILKGTALTADKKAGTREVTLIPYYAWSNRGCNPMKVWFRRAEGQPEE